MQSLHGEVTAVMHTYQTVHQIHLHNIRIQAYLRTTNYNLGFGSGWIMQNKTGFLALILAGITMLNI